MKEMFLLSIKIGRSYLQKISVLCGEGFLFDKWEELVCKRATALGKRECKQNTFMHSSVHASALFCNEILKFKQNNYGGKSIKRLVLSNNTLWQEAVRVCILCKLT